MNTFLGNVACYLYERYGDDISSVRILLPNNRSRLFLLDELGKLTERPLWQPKYTTIDDMMREVCGCVTVDRVRAVVELYKIYSKYHQEAFNDFYFWGEMLLNDFDQVDKYMVDADMLFANLSDLKAIDGGLEYFNDEQREVVRRFWSSFGVAEEYSDEKRDFLSIWHSLASVYREFRERLSSMGMAYTGMMHRSAAEKIRSGEFGVDSSSPIAVVGFNALSACEKVLFDHLRNTCDAMFFWDYDDYYLNDKYQEAGLFVRENILRYPQPSGFVNDTANFTKDKNITAVSVPSGALECKYAADFIRDVVAAQGGVGKETAIVLTDESLLVPLLYSIPADVGEVNVTMGYPLRQTTAYSFVERLLRLQTHTRIKGGADAFYHADVTGILMHPFIVELDAENAAEISARITSRSQVYVPTSAFTESKPLAKVFCKQNDWNGVTEWVLSVLSDVVDVNAETHSDMPSERKFRREYVGLIADSLRRLSNSLKDCGVEVDVPLFSSLARRMLQNLRVPYEGEPLRGVQIMGILETRNLDFENVMIMSMNDDNFPGNPAASSSFIPYNLRLGYGLPTPQHHDGVYAYYFYRLMQRAGRVDMVYSSKSDENSSGEQSRYVYQLEYESRHDVQRVDIGLDVGVSLSEPITVDKNSVVMDRLSEFLDDGGQTISPTALNTYLDCPLKFYFRYVARLRPEDEVAEEIDVPMFGTILHRAMELLYEPLVGIENPSDKIKSIIGTQSVPKAVDSAVRDVFFHGDDVSVEEYEGNVIMIRDIVIRYINDNILPFDSRLQDFAVIALEQRLTARFGFETGGRRHSVVFSGLADRIDRIAGSRVRIVDYKTGSPHIDFAGVGALFSVDEKERNPAVLQTLLYSLMASRMQQSRDIEGVEVCPSLYYVRMMHTPDYSPLLNIKGGGSVTGYEPYREEFEQMLGDVLSELFGSPAPFIQCVDTRPCEYCDFKDICRRI